MLGWKCLWATGILAAIVAGCGRQPDHTGSTPRVWQVLAGPRTVQLHVQSPAGVAVAPNGDVYVADRDAGTLQKVSASGDLLAIWRLGRGGRPLRSPDGVAVAPDGSVWVSESDAGRIDHFSSAGKTLSQVGRTGRGPGELDAPGGLAVDGNRLFVADSGNERVDIFSTSGTYLTSWRIRTRPSAADEVDGVSVGRRGSLYVLDRVYRSEMSGGCLQTPMEWGQNVVVKLDTRGRVVARWPLGVWKSLQGVDTGGIAVDRTGHVAVADSASGMVRVLAPNGRQIASWGPASNLLQHPTSVAVGQGGTLYVTDSGSKMLIELTSSGRVLADWGNPDRVSDALHGLTSLVAGLNGEVYAGGLHGQILVVSGHGGIVGRWSVPHDRADDTSTVALALGQHGTLLAVNGGTNSPSVLELSSSGKTSGTFPATALQADVFAMAEDSRGNLFVLQDAASGAIGTPWIVKLSPSGKDIADFGYDGSGKGELTNPSGLAVDQSGDVFVADAGNNRIARFSSSGAWLGQIGVPGRKPGDLESPNDVKVGGRGDVFVADSGNNRIQEFSSAGKVLRVWGKNGGAPGEFSDPNAIAVDGAGTIYVSDAGNDRIQAYAPRGAVVASVAGGFSALQLAAGGPSHPVRAESRSPSAQAGCGPPASTGGNPCGATAC